MGKSTSDFLKPVIGQSGADIFGSIVDPLQIEKTNYEKRQIEKETKRAEKAQKDEQQKLLNEQKLEREKFEKQQALTKERAVEEGGYAAQAVGGMSTLLTGGLSDEVKTKNRNKKTILGSFLK